MSSGTIRNKPCSCGSTAKYKKCCLLIDRFIARAKSRRNIKHLRVALPYSTIKSRIPVFKDLVKSLINLPTKQTLQYLSMLNSFLFTQDLSSHQLKMAEFFLAPIPSKKVVKILKEVPYHIFVSEHQLLILTRLLLFIDEVKEGTFSYQSLGEPMLLANDFIDMPHEKEVASKNQSAISKKELFAGLVIRQSQIYDDDIKFSVSRTYSMLYHITQELISSENYINFIEEFKNAIGISLIRYLSMMFGITGTWLKFDNTNLEELKPADISSYFNETVATEEEVDKFINSCALQYEDYSKAIKDEIKDESSSQYDYVTFSNYPLIRFGNDVYPISLRLLLNKFNQSIYWILHAHFKEIGDKELNKFFRFFGEIYEQYIIKLIKPICNQFDNNIRLRGKAKEQGPELDILILENNSLIIIEVKSSRLNLPILKSGDIDSFKENMNQTITKPAKQLSNGIDLLLEGKFETNLDLSKVEKIYPVIAHYCPFPEDISIRQIINAELDKENLLSQVITAPVTLLDVRDIENSLSLFEKHGFSMLLDKKTNNELYCALSFMHFVTQEFKDNYMHSTLKKQFDEVGKIIEEDLFPKQERNISH